MRYRNQYLVRIVYAGDTAEVYKTQSYRYGQKIQRGKNEKPTSDAVTKINQDNAERKLRQIINENFRDGDYHIVLTYKKDLRPETEEAEKELGLILRRLRTHLNKRGIELKYIAATEVGARGAIHHHLIVNREAGSAVAREFRRRVKVDGKWEWARLGATHMTPLYTCGQYRELANYIIKQTSQFLRREGGPGQRWRASKNLRKPREVVKVVRAKTWRKQPQPLKGYRFDPNFPLENGACAVTGLAYQRYGLIKIKERRGRRGLCKAGREISSCADI